MGGLFSVLCYCSIWINVRITCLNRPFDTLLIGQSNRDDKLFEQDEWAINTDHSENLTFQKYFKAIRHLQTRWGIMWFLQYIGAKHELDQL